MSRIIRCAAIFVAPLAALLTFAAPALADSGPVNVSASVAQSVTISGLTASVSFPGTSPGQTASLTPAESYTVSTNDPNGYILRLSSGANSFAGPSSATIANSNWTIIENSTGSAHAPINPSTTGTAVFASSSASSDTYSENWSLAIPGGQPAGSYTNSLTYLAVGQ